MKNNLIKKQQVNQFGVWAFITGIFSIFLAIFLIPLGPLAIFLSYKGIKEAKKLDGLGIGLSKIGLILAIIGTICWLIAIPLFLLVREMNITGEWL